MKKINRFLYYRELNNKDCFFCIILLLIPVFMLFIPLNTKYIIFITLLILYLVCIAAYEVILNTNVERYKKLPRQYKLFVNLSIFIIIGWSVFIVGVSEQLNDESQIFYFVVVVFALTIFLYLACIIIFLKGIGTYLYYFFLKKLFPEEDSTEPQYYTREELSKFISIFDQKRVLNTILVNLLFYYLGIGYIFIWLMTKIKRDDVISNTLVDFAVNYNKASFGNTVGLFSLIITVYTVTYSIQGKIFDQAVTLCKKEKEGIE